MEQPELDRTLSKAREIPSRAEDIASDARTRLNESVAAMSDKARYAARYADQRVQSNPWTAVGIGFGAGMVFGALLAMAISSQRSLVNRL